MRRVFRLALMVAVVLLVLSGCTTQHHGATGNPGLVRKDCDASHGGYMGCAAGVKSLPVSGPREGLPPATLVPRGCIIADVSSYQGHPNWSEARSHICGGIYKAGESDFTDPDASYNQAELSALGLWHTAYWFVRPTTNCTTEADDFVAELHRLDYGSDKLAGPPVLDMEVSGIAGYAPCMAKVIDTAFHVYPVIYTAPGTWPGGSSGGLLAWVAAYTNGTAPPCLPFRCNDYVAWQFAAPPYVYYYVPGLGYQDESVDYTFTGETPFNVPTVGPKQVSRWQQDVNSSYRVFAGRGCVKHLGRSDCFLFGYHRVLYFRGKLEAGGQPRIHCYGAHAEPSTHKCRVVVPYVKRWMALEFDYRLSHPAQSAHYAKLVKLYRY